MVAAAIQTTVHFELLGTIEDAETIAAGHSIRELPRLRKLHGAGRWRKRKGIASVRVGDGTIHQAEVHWYEAHGVGRREIKVKRLLD
jgi:hypothetical protein